MVAVVLYKMTPDSSPTIQALHRAIRRVPLGEMEIQVEVYDNTPGARLMTSLPEYVEYMATGRNEGLADPYNRAVQQGPSRNFEWLLTLDQDTSVPENFLEELIATIRSYESNTELVAILPIIKDGSRMLSSKTFRWGRSVRFFPEGYVGVPSEEVTAFNSGSTYRLDAIAEVGGYNTLFWLDYSDTYLFRKLWVNGKSVLVAGNMVVEHDFSMMDMKNRVSVQRYQNFLEAGSAFADMELGFLGRLECTLRLFARYIKRTIKRDGSEFASVNLKVLAARLFQTKEKRLGEWTRQQQMRAAGSSSK